MSAPPPTCRVWLIRRPPHAARPGRWPRALRHALARDCIAEHLGVAASAVQLGHTSSGQPIASAKRDGRRIAVSLSDTEQVLAVAVLAHEGHEGADDAAPPRLGIDIESLAGRPMPLDTLPWLAPAESAAIGRAPERERRRHFLAVWTQKEAYLKALGQGLDADLSGFEVEVDPTAPAALQRPLPGTDAAAPLHLRRLGVADLAGAIASDDPDLRVHVTHALLSHSSGA